MPQIAQNIHYNTKDKQTQCNNFQQQALAVWLNVDPHIITSYLI